MKKLVLGLLILTASCSSEGSYSTDELSPECECQKFFNEFEEEGIRLMRPELGSEENERIYNEHVDAWQEEIDDCSEVAGNKFNSLKKLTEHFKYGDFGCH